MWDASVDYDEACNFLGVSPASNCIPLYRKLHGFFIEKVRLKNTHLISIKSDYLVISPNPVILNNIAKCILTKKENTKTVLGHLFFFEDSFNYNENYCYFNLTKYTNYSNLLNKNNTLTFSGRKYEQFYVFNEIFNNYLKLKGCFSYEYNKAWKEFSSKNEDLITKKLDTIWQPKENIIITVLAKKIIIFGDNNPYLLKLNIRENKDCLIIDKKKFFQLSSVLEKF